MTPVTSLSQEHLIGRWRALEDRAIFRLTGSDRVRYLNGQVSNDVAKLRDQESIAACLCTLKGKVEALVHIQVAGEVLLLDGELRQREFLAARLEKYLIADDCEIEDCTGILRLIHHFFDDTEGTPSRRLSIPGRDQILSATNVDSPFPDKAALSDADWSRFEILSLIPQSTREITAEEFPAELRLDSWAVDFHKGCYLGQEIISRIRSVGRVNRHLHRVTTEAPVAQGETLQTREGLSGKATRDSVALSEKSHLTLALLGAKRASENPLEDQRLATDFETPHQL